MSQTEQDRAIRAIGWHADRARHDRAVRTIGAARVRRMLMGGK